MDEDVELDVDLDCCFVGLEGVSKVLLNGQEAVMVPTGIILKKRALVEAQSKETDRNALGCNPSSGRTLQPQSQPR